MGIVDGVLERLTARLLAKADVGGPDDCWPWLGSTHRKGYGRFRVGPRTEQAHRVAYELLVGPIPAGLEIDHTCRNRACVNPAHLEPVTPAENKRRAVHVLKTHCPQGHPYSEENTRQRTGGRRRCRTCARDEARERMRARRAAA